MAGINSISRLAQIQNEDEDFYSKRSNSSRHRHRHEHDHVRYPPPLTIPLFICISVGSFIECQSITSIE